MKQFILCIGLLFYGLTARAEFLTGTEDIPLMEGIILEPADDFSFDSPAGQILILDGQTTLDQAQIRSFYDKTLTAMGWKRVRTGVYARGGDDFKVSFPARGRVRFDITLTGAE